MFSKAFFVLGFRMSVLCGKAFTKPQNLMFGPVQVQSKKSKKVNVKNSFCFGRLENIRGKGDIKELYGKGLTRR